MLKSIRRVPFPLSLQSSGPLIKASLIDHVKCHAELMEKAEDSAAKLLAQAQEESDRMRNNVQAEVAKSLKHDLKAIRNLTKLKEKALYERSTELCTEVCAAVFQQVIQELPAREKIRSLVEILLTTEHHGRVLQLCCHPEQVQLVETEVGKVMAEQLNLRQWNVKGSPELQPFEIIISTANGAEIQIALDNLMAIYKEEIQALGNELASLIHLDEENNENIN